MTPFQRLGLKPGSDEREIKRAYARELKRCRPDDDPVAFQALQEAYRECLQQAAQLRLAQADDEADDTDAGHYRIALDEDGLAAILTAADDAEGARADAPERPDNAGREPDIAGPLSGSSAQPCRAGSGNAFAPLSARHFDIDGFLSELLQRARTSAPLQLERWLQDVEPLYSLELKHALREPLARALAGLEPPLAPDALRTVFAFFALDQVGVRETHLLEYTRHAQVRADAALEFERTLARYQPPQGTSIDLALLREVHGPRSWWRRLGIALVPGLPGRAAGLATALLRIDPERASRQLDRESVELWRSAADPTRIALPRLAVVVLRMLLYPLPLLGPISADRASGSPEGLLTISLTLAALWMAGATIRMLWLRWLIAQQRGEILQIWRDAPLQLFAGLAFTTLILLPLTSGFSSLLAIGTGGLWLMGRGRERMGRTLASMGAGLLLALCLPPLLGAAFALPEPAPPQVWLAGASAYSEDRSGWLPLYLLLAAATPVLQDLWLAVRQRIDLVRARERAPRPWTLVAAAVLALGARIALP